MDLKGIELTGALLTSTDQAARRKRRQKGLIKPVAKMDKTLLAPNTENRDPSTPQVVASERDNSKHRKTDLNEETAEQDLTAIMDAADRISRHISAYSDIEAEWRLLQQNGELIIEIRDQRRGRIVKEISSRDLVSGRLIDGESGDLRLIDKKA